MKKAREWNCTLVSLVVNNDPAKPLGEMVHVREVLPNQPDEISDTDRLNWVIDNQATFAGYGNHIGIHTYNSLKKYKADSIREAIDCAMKESKNG